MGEKSKTFWFQLLRNTSPLKKLRAKSLEEALGMAKQIAKHDKDNFFELKSLDGRLIQIFVD